MQLSATEWLGASTHSTAKTRSMLHFHPPASRYGCPEGSDLVDVCRAQRQTGWQNQAWCSPPAQPPGDRTTLAWLLFLVPPYRYGGGCQLLPSVQHRRNNQLWQRPRWQQGQRLVSQASMRLAALRSGAEWREAPLSKAGGLPCGSSSRLCAAHPPRKTRGSVCKCWGRGLKSIHVPVLISSKGKVP